MQVSLLSVVNRSCRSECSDRWFEGTKFCLKLSDQRSEHIIFYWFFRSPIWRYQIIPKTVRLAIRKTGKNWYRAYLIASWGGESTRGQTSQEAKRPKGERARANELQSESSNVWGWISQGANKPGGESARHRKRFSQGAKKPENEQARRRKRPKGERARGWISRKRNGKEAKKL